MKESFDLPVLPAWPNAVRRQVETFESLPLLRQFLDAGPYALVVNSKRQIVFASAALLELVGQRGLDSVVGMRIGEAFQCAHLEETPGGCGASEYCRQCGGNNAILSAQTGLKEARECRIARRAGSLEEPLDLLVKATPVVVAGERYVFCSILDISHEKRRYALERIFLHDVVNTAGTIVNLAAVIEDTVPEDGRTWVHLLSRSARRLLAEVQGQRQLMEAESGELAVNVEPTNTGALLADIVAMYAGSAVGRDRNLVVQAGADDIRIDSDPALLARVLANLVKNALEASKAGETVTVNCRRLDDWVEFAVHNPAVMTPEVRRQVFQRSFSTKGQGRGLGTYSIKLLTERYLGGSVAFHSTRGEGTTFRVCYPRFLNVHQ